MATSHLRSACSSSMPEAAGSSTMPPEPPAEQAAAIDHRVDGSRGRHQVTTLPSSSSVEPPLTTPSVAILSAHHMPHDSQSTGCMECKDIRDHFQDGLWNHRTESPNLMPLALRVVGRSEYFASGSGKHFWRSLSAVLMDAAPVLATQKRSDRPLEDPGGPCRAWIESDVKGGLYKLSLIHI